MHEQRHRGRSERRTDHHDDHAAPGLGRTEYRLGTELPISIDRPSGKGQPIAGNDKKMVEHAAQQQGQSEVEQFSTEHVTKDILRLREVTASDRPEIGGKAASLALAAGAGFPVPATTVVTASALERFIKRPGATSIARGLTREEYDELIADGLPGELHVAMAELGSARFAVRSSATVEDGADRSYAGMFRSHLNVRPEDVLSAVLDVCVSVTDPRVQAYAGSTPPRMAAIVQAMIDADVSGVLFSKHPAGGNDRVVVVEAVYGLAESLVGGTVTPDYYVVERTTGVVLEHRDGDRQHQIVPHPDSPGCVLVDVPRTVAKLEPLNERQLVDLTAIARSAEALYHTAVDVEWAIHGNVLVVLQIRPITTPT